MSSRNTGAGVGRRALEYLQQIANPLQDLAMTGSARGLDPELHVNPAAPRALVVPMEGPVLRGRAVGDAHRATPWVLGFASEDNVRGLRELFACAFTTTSSPARSEGAGGR